MLSSLKCNLLTVWFVKIKSFWLFFYFIENKICFNIAKQLMLKSFQQFSVLISFKALDFDSISLLFYVLKSLNASIISDSALT